MNLWALSAVYSFFCCFISGLWTIAGYTRMYVFLPDVSFFAFHFCFTSFLNFTSNSNYTVNVFKCYRLHALETMLAHLTATDHPSRTRRRNLSPERNLLTRVYDDKCARVVCVCVCARCTCRSTRNVLNAFGGRSFLVHIDYIHMYRRNTMPQ